MSGCCTPEGSCHTDVQVETGAEKAEAVQETATADADHPDAGRMPA
jgi:hypothetical protein